MKHMKSQRCICYAKIRNKTCNIDRMTHYMKLKNILRTTKDKSPQLLIKQADI